MTNIFRGISSFLYLAPIRKIISGLLLPLTICFSGSLAAAWEALPVADSAIMAETGSDYYVEISCRRENETSLGLKIFRFFPPIDEIQAIRRVKVKVAAGPAGFEQTIDMTYSEDRDIALTGILVVSRNDLDMMGAASAMQISDTVTGRVIFSSNMTGSQAARDVFRTKCGI